MKVAFERYFHGQYAAARPYLLLRVLLSMLALDTWMLMIGHAGRYGAGGFNVAHFRWLDALAPLPSPGLYIGVLLLAGLLSLVVAMSGIRRPIGALLLALYTYSWSMSMLDSYQHHYFVSLLLACVVFFPNTSAHALHPPPHPTEQAAEAQSDRQPLLTTGFGFPLLCATVALLYVFTALAKCDANWLDGATIQRISTSGEVLAKLRRLALSLGIEDSRFWSLLSTSVIPHELFIALGYALAPLRDHGPDRGPDGGPDGGPGPGQATPVWLRRLCTLAGVAALLLHVGAEGMGLEIGWFSYYMMALAVGVLLPAPWVQGLSRVVTLPAAWLADALSEQDAADEENPALRTLLMALGVGAILHVTGRMIDLPGALGAGWAAGAALLAYVVVGLAADRPLAGRPVLLAAGAAAAVMWLSIQSSDVRWDYYRFRGGDLMRRGELEEALSTYERGERYAVPRSCKNDRACTRFGGTCDAGLCVDAGGRPVRDSRMHKIEQLRARLGR